MTTGRINQVDPHSELRRSSAFEGRGSHRRKYGSGDPEAAFQSKCRQGTKSRQGALLVKAGPGICPPPRSVRATQPGYFHRFPAVRGHHADQSAPPQKGIAAALLYRTFAPWGLPTASPRKGLLCQSRFIVTVRCPGGTRATRLGPSRRSHEPRSHPVISVTPKVPERSEPVGLHSHEHALTRSRAVSPRRSLALGKKNASCQVANPPERKDLSYI